MAEEFIQALPFTLCQITHTKPFSFLLQYNFIIKSPSCLNRPVRSHQNALFFGHRLLRYLSVVVPALNGVVDNIENIAVIYIIILLKAVIYVKRAIFYDLFLNLYIYIFIFIILSIIFHGNYPVLHRFPPVRNLLFSYPSLV